MSYQLYITSNCHECEYVLSKLAKWTKIVEVLNVDDRDLETPIPVFVYPAIFKDKLLIAYGSDILEYLEKQES